MSADIEISIVIPALNESLCIGNTVRKIRNSFASCSELANSYDITVCDNGSVDDTAAIVKKLNCNVVSEPIQQVSRARNTGARATNGKWLLFIDSDTWPPSGLVQEIALLIKDSNCIGCGSTIEVVDGPRWFQFVWESKNWSMRTFKWCPGAFVLCRRSAFDEINGFSDEQYMFEEVDFIKRLKKFGKGKRQKFHVLHKHPFCTSGRRGSAKSIWWFASLAFRLSFFHKKSIRNKALAKEYFNKN